MENNLAEKNEISELMEAYKKGIGKKAGKENRIDKVEEESNLSYIINHEKTNELCKGQNLVFDNKEDNLLDENLTKVKKEDCYDKEEVNFNLMFDQSIRDYEYLKKRKKDKYFVEPVEVRTDFSEFGELADLIEDEQKLKLLEYDRKVKEMEILKAKDKEKEKIFIEINKIKKIAEARTKRENAKLKKLFTKANNLGHYGTVNDYCDKMNWIQMYSMRRYYKIINHSGFIIAHGDFIEIGSSGYFYIYNRSTKLFTLYQKDNVQSKILKLDEQIEQVKLWDKIKQLDPHEKLGFKFIRFDKSYNGLFY